MSDQSQHQSTSNPKEAEDRRTDRSGPNEGEGSQTGAHEYNEATRRFVESGQVEDAAQDAERAVSSPEADELQQAEAEGTRRSHGEDPLLCKTVRP